MSGFITLHREAFDHPILKDGDRFRAWFWMVSKACWKPTKFDINGKIITLGRGQLCVSRQQLADAWGWSASAVERFLTRLQTEQMIGRATGQGRSIITICNYAKYQDAETEPGQATGQATGQRSDSDRTAKEQGNHLTKVEKESKASFSSARAREIDMPDSWEPNPFSPGTQSRSIVDGWTGDFRKSQFERFTAHHQAKGNRFRSWQAAWKTWVLNSKNFEGKSNGNRSQFAHDNRDGAIKTLSRDLGFDGPAAPPGRYDAGDGGGDSVIPIARARPL